MGATTIVTGTPGTSIAAQCTGPTPGTKAQAGDVTNALTSVENDLATIKAGTYTTSAVVTHTGVETFSNAVHLNGATSVAVNEAITLTDETSLIKLGASGFVRTRVCETGSRDDGNWTIDAWGVRTATNASGPAIFFTIAIPHLAIVTDVWMFITGGAGHVTLPAIPPAVNIRVVDITTGTETTPGSTTDASGTFGALEMMHSVHLSGLAHTYDATRERLTVEAIGEGGANAVVGDVVTGIYVTYTQPKLV